MEVRIRPAKAGEAHSVLAMYEWLFESPGRAPAWWNEEKALNRLRGAIDAGDAEVLVAEDESGSLIGVAAAYIDLESVRFGRRCWVEDLAVHPDRRSEGIGARLLGAARDWARGQGATHLELDTGEARAAARRFYERESPHHVGISYSWELRSD
jgi:GNAT superfamily N-acetyltransferase